jgi:hypothetical protein
MKKIFVILFAGLLVSAGLQAQKVSVKNGKVILDLTKEAGMPEGAITSVPKSWNGRGTPVNTGLALTGNLQHEDINATVFQKLEVAPKDMNTSGGMDGTGTMLMDWKTAFEGCLKSTYNGGGWRLPTQREMMLMWVLYDMLKIALSKVTGGTLLLTTPYYRVATETNGSDAWLVSFGTGGAQSNALKTALLPVRCVREVTP